MIVGCDNMSTFNIEETHGKLTEQIKEYIELIKKEYGAYIPVEVLQRLSAIDDYSQILKIYDYGEVSAYANENNVIMPLCADKLLRMASKIPGYGISKNHKPYNEENIIVNNNTFLTYIMHVFISGTNAEGYYEDLLLHEVMHFCGSDGASVLKEGINELLTRMLAKKYNLRTNSCGYPKEVKLAYDLMNCFGENIVIRLAFINGFENELNFIRENLGDAAANLYFQVCNTAEKEFNEKYYSHMSEFSGAIGIAKKVLFYKRIDYSKVYQMINNYTISLSNSNEFKHR